MRHIYRYRVAEPGVRVGLNRYPQRVIGAYLVIGAFAYCIRWRHA